MSSTYTQNVGIEKPTAGELIGTWATNINNDFDIIDEALDGVVSISLTGSPSTYNGLTFTNGVTPCLARNRILIFTGTPGSDVTIPISKDPNAFGQLHKFYIVVNQTSRKLTFQTSAGDAFTLTPERRSSIIYCDGNGNVESVPAPSNVPTSVDITNTSAITVQDGQGALVLTGTPASDPQTITLSTLPAQNSTVGPSSTMPMLLWVVNRTNKSLVLKSGTGTTTYTLGALSSTPVYVDGSNDIYGGLFAEGVRTVTLTGTPSSIPLIPGVQAYTFVGSGLTGAVLVNLPDTTKTTFWAINNTGQSLTFKAGSGSTLVLAAGLTNLLSLDGAGNVTSVLSNGLAIGALACGAITSSGAITGASLSVAGAVSSASVTATGQVAGATLAATGNLTCTNAAVSAALTASSLTLNGMSVPLTAASSNTYNPNSSPDGAISVTAAYYRTFGPYVHFAFDVTITPSANRNQFVIPLPATGHVLTVPAPVSCIAGVSGGVNIPLSGYLSQGSEYVAVVPNTLLVAGSQFLSGIPYRIICQGTYLSSLNS